MTDRESAGGLNGTANQNNQDMYIVPGSNRWKFGEPSKIQFHVDEKVCTL